MVFYKVVKELITYLNDLLYSKYAFTIVFKICISIIGYFFI